MFKLHQFFLRIFQQEFLVEKKNVSEKTILNFDEIVSLLFDNIILILIAFCLEKVLTKFNNNKKKCMKAGMWMIKFKSSEATDFEEWSKGKKICEFTNWFKIFEP